MSIPRLPSDGSAGSGTSAFTTGSGAAGPGTAGGAAGGAGGAGGSSSGGSAAAPPVPGPGSAATTKSFTGMFQVVRGIADRSEFGPPVDVPPGAVVSIAAIPTNTVNAFASIGAGFEAAKAGPRFTLAAAGNPRTVKVRNLREIGVYSIVVGEGVTIDIQEGA